MGPWPVTHVHKHNGDWWIPLTKGQKTRKMHPLDDVIMKHTHKPLNTSRTIPFGHNLLLTYQAISYISQSALWKF